MFGFFSPFRIRAEMSKMCDVTQWLSCIVDNLSFEKQSVGVTLHIYTTVGLIMDSLRAERDSSEGDETGASLTPG